MTDPKDLEGNKQPADMGLLATHLDRVETTMFDIYALLIDSKDELKEASDDNVFESLSPPKEQPESSKAKETDASDSRNIQHVSNVLYAQVTKDHWEKHEEVAASYADLKDTMEGYYEENVDHRDQADKLVKKTMNHLDKISQAGVDERAKLLKESLKLLRLTLLSGKQCKRWLSQTTPPLAKSYVLADIANSLKATNFPCFQARITAAENTRVIMQAAISSINRMVLRCFKPSRESHPPPP
ncbi:hypothetical protein Tco_0611596 [Tanacetum coccineum]